MKKVKESNLYPIVQKWLTETPHFCSTTAIDKGLDYTRIDVIGVKDVGGDLSGEVETIAVEVKRGEQPFVKASGQALAYRVYANRIYLADLRDNPFTSDEIQIASHLGIGLVQIQNNGCSEVLSSPYFKPLEKLKLLLLENLYLGRCQLCGCFFKIGGEQHKFSNLTREDFRKAIKQEKGLMFWNREVNERKREAGIVKKKDDKTYERRFICPDCTYLFSLLQSQD